MKTFVTKLGHEVSPRIPKYKQMRTTKKPTYITFSESRKKHWGVWPENRSTSKVVNNQFESD